MNCMVVANEGPSAAGWGGGGTGCCAKAAESAVKPRTITIMRRVFITKVAPCLERLLVAAAAEFYSMNHGPGSAVCRLFTGEEERSLHISLTPRCNCEVGRTLSFIQGRMSVCGVLHLRFMDTGPHLKGQHIPKVE